MDETLLIDELIQDDHNFNKGNAEGHELIVKSFEEFGAGRSVLIDKDNRLISGNSSVRAAIQSGIRNVRVIETTGDELVAVRRKDMSLDSQKGRGMAFADNVTGQINLTWDDVQLQNVCEALDINTNAWGLEVELFFGGNVDIDNLLSDRKNGQTRRSYIVKIRIPRSQREKMDEIINRVRGVLEEFMDFDNSIS